MKRIQHIFFLLGLFLSACGADQASNGQDFPLIRHEFRFYHPGAGEVFLVWGVNGWEALPEGNRPPGTVVVDSVMQTTMVKEGDGYIARLDVPAWTTVNYGFLITKTSAGTPIEAVWDGNESYQIITGQETRVIENKSNVALSGAPAPAEAILAEDAPEATGEGVVTRAFRYRMPEAGEVFLVWGVDGWGIVAEAIRPVGTVLKDGLMHTPLARDGEWFTTRVLAPAGSTVEYGFLITKTSAGAEINPAFWEGNDNFRFTATGEEVIEVESQISIGEATKLPGQFSFLLYLLVGLGILGFAAFMLINLPSNKVLAEIDRVC
jgi:hypothetical protein